MPYKPNFLNNQTKTKKMTKTMKNCFVEGSKTEANDLFSYKSELPPVSAH